MEWRRERFQGSGRWAQAEVRGGGRGGAGAGGGGGGGGGGGADRFAGYLSVERGGVGESGREGR